MLAFFKQSHNVKFCWAPKGARVGGKGKFGWGQGGKWGTAGVTNKPDFEVLGFVLLSLFYLYLIKSPESFIRTNETFRSLTFGLDHGHTMAKTLTNPLRPKFNSQSQINMWALDINV